MVDHEEKKLPTVAGAPRIDGFAGYEDSVEGGEQESSNRVIQGELVKFTNEATWVGRDGEELPSDLELIVIDIGRIVQKWHDGNPVETIILAPGQPFPDVKAMNDQVPREEWIDGPDGQPRGPWQAQHIAYMLDPKNMSRFSYPTGTVGGAIAIRDLVDRTKFVRRFRGPNTYPVVTLGDVFMNTRFGGRQRPHFEVKRWVTIGEGGNALPAPEMPQLPGPQEVQPPSAKEATGDDIRH